MNKLFITILTFTLSACTTGSDQFAKSMVSEYGLRSYSISDIEDREIKGKVAFIFTLLANTSELRMHQFNGESDNEVYIQDDEVNGGYAEMVVRFERDANGNKVDGTGKYVTDCENMGSFNYKHPQKEPLGHFAQDILPWLKWGNCREDTTTTEQRIAAYIADVELSLEQLVAQGSGYYLPNGFDFKHSGQAETIAFFFKVFAQSDFDLNNFVLSDKSSRRERAKLYGALKKGMNSLVRG